jgi:ketosteroid isomerase-like protein
MKRILLIASCFAGLSIVFGQEPRKSEPAPEEAILKAEEAWINALASKSIEKTMSCYDPEAVTAGAAMPSSRGHEQLRDMWTSFFAQPGFTISGKADKVAIIKSGTIAYSTGTWYMPKGSGPYIAVWRKQPNGHWKVLIDAAWNAQSPK